ncbi:MAG: UDP-3-O-(3-hydroxymyristoyl)glucosamine N-acyltransferase [Paucibacter sp.]|nr:UDP-3-O-(3-hydroxymyristoyl)glucosamine N-acyltransferase [Roseateles sp.]
MIAETTLGEIAATLGGDLLGEAALRVTRIGPLESADAGTIAFLANPRYASQLAGTQATCVIVAPASAEAAAARGAAIVTPDPYLYFARLSQWWAARVRPLPPAAIHPSAVVAADAQIAAGVDIGPLAVVESGAVIAEGARIGSHTVIGRNARVGAGTRIAANVSIAFDCVLGERCIVHSGVVIGADGFGFAPAKGSSGPEWVKIEQLGAVRVGDDVEIGANTCIDRGALEDTVIGNGVKLDNLIQIGHNVRIGDHTVIAAFTGIAGSAVIGRHCLIGGAARIQGHIEICDSVTVSTCTFISHSIKKPGNYSGAYPFEENASWEKNAATLRQLYPLRQRVRALEKKIDPS